MNCDINDNGTPFYDNLKFCVYNPSGGSLSSNTLERYADSFPTANGSYLTQTARSDGPRAPLGHKGIPLRYVRSDSAACTMYAANVAMFLRFAVERGALPAKPRESVLHRLPAERSGHIPEWPHLACGADGHRTLLMARAATRPERYMTCFHENDPRNSTIWPPSMPPPFEPCDDILPDNLFTAGTNVYYFFEARNATTGAVIGTFPAGERWHADRDGRANHKDLWLQMNVLPELNPNCDGTQANGMLIVSDYQTNAVPGRGTIQRQRLVAALGSLGLEFDVYDTQGTNYTDNTTRSAGARIGQGQAPRPPHNGATRLSSQATTASGTRAGSSGPASR